MSEPSEPSPPKDLPEDLSVVVRRVIAAPAQRLFAAWTDPTKLQHWWGPSGVRCTRAESDTRVGGSYRIDNELPDGRVIVIQGEFLEIVTNRRLVYTWRTSADATASERVTVNFEPQGDRTEVVVTHERIESEQQRAGHEQGWQGCLDGLAAYV